MPTDGNPGEAAVEDQLRQARQALADAEGTRNAELADSIVVNPLYNAYFHAAQTVLYDRENNPSTHGGVLTLFGSEIVVAGDISREDGRLLNDLSELRKQADYSYGTLDENVDAHLARTRQFASQMESLYSFS